MQQEQKRAAERATAAAKVERRAATQYGDVADAILNCFRLRYDGISQAKAAYNVVL